MPKKLKTHAASFKFKVVLESFTTNNVAETARKYILNANQLSTWRSYFLEHGPSLFQTDVTKREQELEKQIARSGDIFTALPLIMDFNKLKREVKFSSVAIYPMLLNFAKLVFRRFYFYKEIFFR